jgi:cell division septation protein DedD
VPKNEDGEFELVLGNHQLFGVFFIVVMLFGVFFVMGYIVGQNSAPLNRNDVASARKPESKPIVVDSPGRTEEPPAAAPPEAAAAPVETAPQQPARIEPVPAKTKVVDKPAPPKSPSNQPAAGETYLQLAATGKDEADALVDVLKKNSFKALDYEMPEKPGTFRVLVGPVKDGEANKLKADLQGKGFQGREAFPRKF